LNKPLFNPTPIETQATIFEAHTAEFLSGLSEDCVGFGVDF
jgi:hypothetical protein